MQSSAPIGPDSRPLAVRVKLALAEARHIRGQQPDCPVGAARGMEGHTVTRILVVEDDEFMAEALVSMLQTIAETNTAAGAELCLQVPSVAPLHVCLWDSSILTISARVCRSSTRPPVRVLGIFSVLAVST